MLNTSYLITLLALIVRGVSAAQSIPYSSNSSFPNSTIPSGTISASPSRITSALSINSSCSSCVIAVDPQGLQQVVWLTNKTWSVTLDTEYVTVTSFNGSNSTALPNTRTVLGDVASLNASAYPYNGFLAQVQMRNNEGYFNPTPAFARGTDGSVGTTSIPYGQPYAEVRGINYMYMVPTDGCPMNMGNIGSEPCTCLMNHWFPAFVPFSGVSTTTYDLDQIYYQPLSPSQMNEDLMQHQEDISPLTPWDGENFSAWLAEDEGFKSAFPNWEDCAIWNTASGPPRVKVPVDALTTTISTTAYGAAPTSSPTAKPAYQPTTPIAKPTTPVAKSTTPLVKPTVRPDTSSQGSSESGNAGSTTLDGSAGSQNGGGSSEDSSNQGNTGSSESSGSQSGSESSGDPGNTGSAGSSGGTEPKGSSDSSGHSGDTSNTASPSAYDTGTQSGQNTAGGSSGSDILSGTQGGGEAGSSGLPGSSGSGTSEPDNVYPNAPFVVSADGHTVSGTVVGSTAVVVAGTTITAGGSPMSAGGALISVHPGASSIAINGDSQPLPIVTPASEPAPTAPFVVSAGGHTLSGIVLGSTAVAIAGTTFTVGSSPISAGGVLISVHPGASSIAINGDSQPLPTAKPASEPAPIATIGGQILTASPGASEVYYAGTTLSRDGPHATISNKDIYVGSSGLVIDSSSTIALPTALTQESSSADDPHAITFTAAGHTFTSSPSGIAVAGTVLPSGSAAVISGTTISYGTHGLVVGNSIIPIPTPHPSSANVASESTHIFTLGGRTFTANPTAVAIAGTTLTLGSPALTISGTAISLGSSGIIIASSTYAIPSDAFPSSTKVIGGETFTINPTGIEVGGQTLSEGGSAITVNGTVISLGSLGLVVAGSTISYHNSPSTAASTTSEGLGAIILAGFGPSSTSTSSIAPTGTGSLTGTSTLVGFQGKATKLGQDWEGNLILGSLLLGGWMIYLYTW